VNLGAPEIVKTDMIEDSKRADLDGLLPTIIVGDLKELKK